MQETYREHILGQLGEIRAAGTYKNERIITTPQDAHIQVAGGQRVLNMCANNAIVVLDDAGNRKLSKKRSTGRIDGMVALAMALGVAPLRPPVIDIEALIA